MKRTAEVVLGFVIVLSALAAFVWYRGSAPSMLPPASVSQDVMETPVVTIRHSSQGGAHTYRGSLSLPACTTLSSSLQTAGTDPLHVFLILNSSKPPGVCEEPSNVEQTFTVTLTSKNNVRVVLDRVVVNNVVADVRLEEV